MAQSQHTTTEKIHKMNAFSRSVTHFWRIMSVLLIFVLLISSSLLAFVLINPNHSLTSFLIENTSLNQFLRISSTSNQDTSAPNIASEAPVGNSLLGLDINNSRVNSSQSTVQVVEQVLPSVLSITVSPKNQSNQTGLSNSNSSAGTGYIINKDGIVVTNKHVISSSCTIGEDNVIISALSSDGQSYTMRLLDIDPVDDIALLQIISDYSNLTPVQFANSDQLRLGEEVIAIGNVLGELQNSVTKGIISGLERNIVQGPTDTCTGRVVNTDGLIQTDAAINRGNSGGPLFNSVGQLVGMNTFGTSEAQNIGLAIPSNTILSSLKSYQTNNDIIRPRLGIFSQPITPIDSKNNEWIPVSYGEIIFAPPNLSAVDPNSAADKAGLKSGDIILAINSTRIEYSQKNPSPLRRLLLTLQAGDEVTLEVLKATPTSDGTFTYEEKSIQIKTKLGGIAFSDGKIIST